MIMIMTAISIRMKLVEFGAKWKNFYLDLITNDSINQAVKQGIIVRQIYRLFYDISIC
jgi:hypothetical protein